jgi:hypothetical protein
MSPLHVSLSFELTGVGLIAVAVWALLFTRRQLAVMQESNGRQAESARNQELQLRASVLLTLDQRWESEPLVSMREELQSLVKDVCGISNSLAGKIDGRFAEIERAFIRVPT